MASGNAGFAGPADVAAPGAASGMRVSYFDGAAGGPEGGGDGAAVTFGASSFAGALAPFLARFSDSRLTNLPSSIGGIFTDDVLAERLLLAFEQHRHDDGGAEREHDGADQAAPRRAAAIRRH